MSYHYYILIEERIDISFEKTDKALLIRPSLAPQPSLPSPSLGLPSSLQLEPSHL